MDKSQIFQLAITFVTGAVAIFAVWLTARFATLRAHDDRLWNRKADAYAAIFEAMNELYHWHDEHLAAEFGERLIDPDATAALNSDYARAKKQIRGVLSSQSWLLPLAVEDHIGEMFKIMSEHHDTFFEAVDNGAWAVKRAKHSLLEIAKVELGRPKLLG